MKKRAAEYGMVGDAGEERSRDRRRRSLGLQRAGSRSPTAPTCSRSGRAEPRVHDPQRSDVGNRDHSRRHDHRRAHRAAETKLGTLKAEARIRDRRRSLKNLSLFKAGQHLAAIMKGGKFPEPAQLIMHPLRLMTRGVRKRFAGACERGRWALNAPRRLLRSASSCCRSRARHLARVLSPGDPVVSARGYSLQWFGAC